MTFAGVANQTETIATWITRLEEVQGWVNAWVNSAQEDAPLSRIYTFSNGLDLTQEAATACGQGEETACAVRAGCRRESPSAHHRRGDRPPGRAPRRVPAGPAEDGRGERDPGRAPGRGGPGDHPRRSAERPAGRAGGRPGDGAEIAAIDAQIPPVADLPSLFRLLQGAADRSAVDFFSFTPGTPVPNAAGTYSTIASQITVSGGYFAIDEFLFLLETLPRAAKVTTLAVTPGSGGAEDHDDDSSGTLSAADHGRVLHDATPSAGPGRSPDRPRAPPATGA